MECKKYLVVLTHTFEVACGWDVEDVVETKEIESDSFEELEGLALEFKLSFSTYSTNADYFLQTVEMRPTIVREPLNEYGETTEEVAQKQLEAKISQYEKLKQEFGE